MSKDDTGSHDLTRTWALIDKSESCVRLAAKEPLRVSSTSEPGAVDCALAAEATALFDFLLGWKWGDGRH